MGNGPKWERAKEITEKPMPGLPREAFLWRPFLERTFPCGKVSLQTFPVADGSPSFMAEIDDYETERGEVMHDQVLRLRLIVCDMFGCLRPFVHACMCGANCVAVGATAL